MIHGISWLREVGLGSISCRRMQRTSWNHSLHLCNQMLETHWRFWFSFQHIHEDSMQSQSCLLDNTIFAGIIRVFRLTESDDVWRVQLQLMEAREINYPVFQNENSGMEFLQSEIWGYILCLRIPSHSSIVSDSKSDGFVFRGSMFNRDPCMVQRVHVLSSKAKGKIGSFSSKTSLSSYREVSDVKTTPRSISHV